MHSGQLEVRAHTEPHLKEKNRKGGKEHSDVLLVSFWAVGFKLQIGSFGWRHAWQTGCSCLSQVKADVFLANMHETMETLTHCRRHKACLSPPELLLPPPVSSSRFCQRDPAEVSNSWTNSY